MRLGSFDELNGVFDGHIVRRRQEKMNVLGHENKGVKLQAAFSSMPIESFQEESRVGFYDEESSSLPG
jgi:hypothetical protein